MLTANPKVKKRILLVLSFLILSIYSCDSKEDINDVASSCHEGVVIGRIRSAGGGLAVSLKSLAFGEHEWRGYENVVEALNLSESYTAGTKIYFKARPATASEKIFIVTADGDESAKPVIYITAESKVSCPE